MAAIDPSGCRSPEKALVGFVERPIKQTQLTGAEGRAADETPGLSEPWAAPYADGRSEAAAGTQPTYLSLVT